MQFPIHVSDAYMQGKYVVFAYVVTAVKLYRFISNNIYQ